MTLILKRITTVSGEKVSDEFVHPKKFTFNLTLPIMTGTFCDPIT